MCPIARIAVKPPYADDGALQNNLWEFTEALIHDATSSKQ